MTTENLPPLARLPLLALGLVALVFGIGAGLARFGWPMPGAIVAAVPLHAALMLGGFFGTVIALERAVATGRLWAYGAPLAAGLASVALLVGAHAAGRSLLVVASLVLLLATTAIALRQRAPFTAVLVVAAGCWCIGSVAWAMGAPLRIAVPWWLAFLVLTIAAERLELSRFMPPSKTAVVAFAGIVAGLLAGLLAGSEWLGRVLAGIALVALAAWLLANDIARRTIHDRGITRYVAACLLAGYAWLAAGGVLVAAFDGLDTSGAAHDATIHALGMGFVFSMVFGHAPIIVPAVLRIRVPYHPVLYGPLALLHASLLARVAGDALSFPLARHGALGNALAVLAFIAAMLWSVRAGRRGGASGRT